jgi:hypothetical protein
MAHSPLSRLGFFGRWDGLINTTRHEGFFTERKLQLLDIFFLSEPLSKPMGQGTDINFSPVAANAHTQH